MYAWFGTNEQTNDKEIEFLLWLNNQVDISNFLISKTFIKIGANANLVFDFLQNPNKFKIFNAQISSLDILSTIEETSSTIFEYALKSTSFWYVGRKYTLISHWYIEENLYILEKSTNYASGFGLT